MRQAARQHWGAAETAWGAATAAGGAGYVPLGTVGRVCQRRGPVITVIVRGSAVAMPTVYCVPRSAQDGRGEPTSCAETDGGGGRTWARVSGRFSVRDLAQQGRAADWKQRPLLRRSRCSQQLTPGVGLTACGGEGPRVYFVPIIPDRPDFTATLRREGHGHRHPANDLPGRVSHL
jgi:hypothetical protein